MVGRLFSAFWTVRALAPTGTVTAGLPLNDRVKFPLVPSTWTRWTSARPSVGRALSAARTWLSVALNGRLGVVAPLNDRVNVPVVAFSVSVCDRAPWPGGVVR